MYTYGLIIHDLSFIRLTYPSRLLNQNSKIMIRVALPAAKQDINAGKACLC